MRQVLQSHQYRLEWVIADDPHFAVYGRQTGDLLCYAREPGLCRVIQALGGERRLCAAQLQPTTTAANKLPYEPAGEGSKR